MNSFLRDLFQPSSRSGEPSAPFWQDFAFWAMGIAFLLGMFVAYTNANGLPISFFFVGILMLGLWRKIRQNEAFLIAPIAFLLVFAMLRTDFFTSLFSGVDVKKAFEMSRKEFLTPLLIFLTTGALAISALRLNDMRAARIGIVCFGFVGVLMLFMALDTLSFGGVRTFFATQVYHTPRPDLILVRLSNSNTVALMLFWPFCYFLNHIGQQKISILLGLILAILGIIVGTNMQTLGLILSLCVFFAAKNWPISLNIQGFRIERILSAGVGLLILGLPILMMLINVFGLTDKIASSLPESWAARIHIWDFTTQKALEKPLWGWGTEAARQFDPPIPIHPHNMALQAFMELGLLGLFALGIFWVGFFNSLTPYNRPEACQEEMLEEGLDRRLRLYEFAPSALATASLYFMINFASYGLWRYWLEALGIVAVIFCTLMLKTTRHYIERQNAT